MVKFLLVGLAGHVVKNAIALDLDLRFLPLSVVQHLPQVFQVPAVGISAHPLEHPLNVHGVHPVAAKFPAHLAQQARLFAHALRRCQLALRALGKIVDHGVLLCAHHHVVDLDDVRRLLQDVPQPSQLRRRKRRHAAALVAVQFFLQRVQVRLHHRAVDAAGFVAQLLRVPDGLFQPRDLPFPVVVHVGQPAVDGVGQAALLPFQVRPVARFHLPLDALPQSVHRRVHLGLGVLHRGVVPAILAPVPPACQPLGGLPVPGHLVCQLQHRHHLVQQIVRDVAALLRVLVQLCQLSRHLPDGPPGVVLVPALPHLRQPLFVLCLRNGHFFPCPAAFGFPLYGRLLLQLPLLRANLLPQLFLGLSVVFLRFRGRIRIGLCHLLPVPCPPLCLL